MPTRRIACQWPHAFLYQVNDWLLEGGRGGNVWIVSSNRSGVGGVLRSNRSAATIDGVMAAQMQWNLRRPDRKSVV